MTENVREVFSRFDAGDLAYIAQLRQDGRSYSTIAKITGFSEARVRGVAAFMATPENTVGRVPEATKDWRIPRSDVRALLSEIAAEYDVSVGEILSDRRTRQIAHARQAAMWALRSQVLPSGKARYSLPQIARFLNRGDHTTILHGVRAHQARLDGGVE